MTKDRNTRWQSGGDPDNKIIGVELYKEGENIYPKEKAAPIARPSAKLWKASPSTTFDLELFAKIWFDNIYTMRAEEGIEDSSEVSFWNILYVKDHHHPPSPPGFPLKLQHLGNGRCTWEGGHQHWWASMSYSPPPPRMECMWTLEEDSQLSWHCHGYARGQTGSLPKVNFLRRVPILLSQSFFSFLTSLFASFHLLLTRIFSALFLFSLYS